MKYTLCNKDLVRNIHYAIEKERENTHYALRPRETMIQELNKVMKKIFRIKKERK